MHILLVSNYFEPDSGAAAVRLTRLAHLLYQQGHQVTVLTSLPHYPQGKIHEGYRGKSVVVENRDGIKIIQTWLLTTQSPRISRKILSQISFMLTAFLRGLFIQKTDVILIEAQPIFPSLAGVALALLKRTPYVLNVSDLWPDHLLSVGALTDSSIIYRIARYIVDFTYHHAHQIIAMSPVWAEKIRHYSDKNDKVKVIYNGVDLTEFRPNISVADFRQKHNLGQHKVISFIGTFATQYDFEKMLDVIRYFKQRDDMQFVFIGQGSQNEFFENNFTKFRHVTWISWIARDEIPQAWNASYLTFWALGDHDLYKGTIPAKLYESMACGVPVAASMKGIGAKIIQESGAGIVVPCKDSNGLIHAIERLLDDENFHEQCRHSARRYAEQHYDHKKVALAYEQILLEAAKK